MCCFTQPVDHVSNTQIFARRIKSEQYLVYSMTYAAREDLAMVLPLPVSVRSPENAVTFVNLERYPNFFGDLRSGFMVSTSAAGNASATISVAKTLKVHEVGDFEASFVPCMEDMERLDPRFRISRSVWAPIPVYADYGFAVFKLKGVIGDRMSIPWLFDFLFATPRNSFFQPYIFTMAS